MTQAAAAPPLRWTPARAVAAAALLALPALIVAWHMWLGPRGEWVPAWLAIVLHSLPLWPGLVLLAIRHRAALFAAAVAALAMFAFGVMEAWSTPSIRALSLAQCALCVLIIGGASLDGLRARFARTRGV